MVSSPPCVAAHADCAPPGMKDLGTQSDDSAAALVKFMLSALQPRGITKIWDVTYMNELLNIFLI